MSFNGFDTADEAASFNRIHGTVGFKLAIAVPGSISFLVTSFTILSILVFSSPRLVKILRRKPKVSANSSKLLEGGSKLSPSSRTTTYINNGMQQVEFANTEGLMDWMILNLLVADFCQSLATMTSYLWTFNDIQSPEMFHWCQFQGLFIAYADLSSAFWSTLVCLTAIKNIFGKRRVELNTLQRFLTQLCMHGIPIVLTLAVYLMETPGQLAYTDNGNHGWCFIGPGYKLQRVWNHYFWIVCCVIINAFGYSYLIYRLHQMKRNSQLRENKDRIAKFRRVIRKLVLYPICFSVLYTPLATDRVLRYVGVTPPSEMTVAFFSLLTLNGFFNSLLYIFKRSIFTRWMNLLGISTKSKLKSSTTATSQSTEQESSSFNGSKIGSETSSFIVSPNVALTNSTSNNNSASAPFAKDQRLYYQMHKSTSQQSW